MQRTDIHTHASRIIVLVGTLGLAYVLGKYGIPVLMPFLLAAITVMFVRPAGKRLARVLSLRPGTCSVALLLVLLGAFGGVAYLGSYYLWHEASAFYAWLSENADSVIDALRGLFATEGESFVLPAFLQKLLALPLISELVGGLDTLVQKLTASLLEHLGESLTGMALGAATSLPSGILSVLVYLLSCFYLALDGEKLLSGALALFAPQSRTQAREIFEATATALRAYLRAYGLLFLLTMGQLLIGFWIIGVRYAFLVAFLISLLDLLPALGAVAVLAPWSALAFASGNVRVGAGLLILAGVVTLTRQIAEPKIVGKSLGLHPLIALVAMYVGLRLFGAAGLVLGPCACIVGKSIVRRDK